MSGMMRGTDCNRDAGARGARSLEKSHLAGAIALAIALVVGGAQGALAFGDGTPDTDPPAEESVCDGLAGRAWGLCVAYCEAQDCPGSDHPSCEVLRDKVFGVLGTDQFPCDGPPGGIG